MFTKEIISDYLYEYTYYNRVYKKFNNEEHIFDLYMKLIKTIVLIPFCLLIDLILFFPFEIGYLIFKKVLK